MREIKFRGWNGKEMLDVYYVTRKGIGALGNGGMIIPKDDGSRAIMQFTGLTDINGAEIYEGDIVVVNDCFTTEVKFYGCGFSVITKSIYANKDFDLTPIDAFEEVKVIGNIYQNQELLK